MIKDYKCLTTMTEEEINRPDTDFAQICSELTALHTRKNHDYGNALERTMNDIPDNMRNGYALGMMRAKVDRITTLLSTPGWVKEESIDDSLDDLACYAIMFRAYRRKNK